VGGKVGEGKKGRGGQREMGKGEEEYPLDLQPPETFPSYATGNWSVITQHCNKWFCYFFVLKC